MSAFDTRLAIALVGATVAGCAVWPAPAAAATTLVHFCDDDAQSSPLPDGAAWSIDVAGSPGSGVGGDGAAAPAATLNCFTITGRSLSMKGPGGFTSYITPGTVATVSYTPPAGQRIVAVSALQQAVVYENSYVEAGIFSSSGRALTDTGPQLAGGELFDLDTPVHLDATALGTDGAAGLAWGIRCPLSLPAGRTQCGGGQYGLTGTITLAHDDSPTSTPTPAPTPPTPTPMPQATLTPIPDQPYDPAPTPTPNYQRGNLTQSAGAPPHVTLSFARRHGGRSLKLTGTANGCTTVTVALPGHRTVSARVASGLWHATVKPRLGTYTATCNKAKTTRRRR